MSFRDYGINNNGAEYAKVLSQIHNHIQGLHQLTMVILNSLQDEGAGFGIDTNKITIIDKNNISKMFPLKSKKDVAIDIVDTIWDYLNQRKTNK